MTSAGSTDGRALRAVRRVRRLPGAERIAGAVAQRLRGNELARKAFGRVFGLGTGTGGPVFLDGGELLGGEGIEDVPVALVVTIGADDLPAVVEAVAQEQVLTAGFRPVFVIDSDDLAAPRRLGYPVEHVVPRQEWVGDELSWREYLGRRLGELRKFYRAAVVVEVHGTDDLGLTMLGGIRGL